MKTLLTLACLLAAASAASAALIIEVDSSQKEYFLSGSASGFPDEDFFSGNGQIAWDNGQPLDGGFVSMLSEASFMVGGNTSAGSFILFLHGNGNLNGAMDFVTADNTTLTGDSSMRYDYSGWSSALQAVLEGKAANGETVQVANGASGSFELSFQTAAVPEPSTGLLIGYPLAAALFLRRGRRRSARR